MDKDILGKAGSTLTSTGFGHAANAAPVAPATLAAQANAAAAAAEAATQNLGTKKANVLMSVDKQREQLSAAIDNLNRMMKEGSRNLSFAMDEVVGGPVVVVKDASSGEVIRQLPNEVVVRMAHHLADFKGKLHNSAV